MTLMDTNPTLHQSKQSKHAAPDASPPSAGRASAAIVPIREIGPRYREQIARHLLSLDERDRYLRFGYAANDGQVSQYVDDLTPGRDHMFGIFDRKLELIAVAHLAYPVDFNDGGLAEFGVSVLPHVRRRGYGRRLFERAAVHAVNDGIQTLYIHTLSENIAMLRIARSAGALVEHAGGGESEAHLKLPEASFRSRLGELLDKQIGQADYLLKAESSAARNLLATIQEVREAVREGRHQSAS
ncbi:MAG: GNAT family N-acetyltransferase [Burkholderiaceae bacterium]|jgi:RimJ/RimL family protein N-acetyltransferase|nr:GNAT family N-acetyltransferase [Burkholderiaceae bacterium]